MVDMGGNGGPPGLTQGQLAQIQASNATKAGKAGYIGFFPSEMNAAASFDPRTAAPLGGVMPGPISAFNTCKKGGMLEKAQGKIAEMGAAFLANLCKDMRQANVNEVYGHGLDAPGGSFSSRVSGAPITGAPIRPSGQTSGQAALLQHMRQQGLSR